GTTGGGGTGTSGNHGKAASNATAFMQPRVSRPSALILTNALTIAWINAEARMRQVASTVADITQAPREPDARSDLLAAAKREQVVRHLVVTGVDHFVVH